MHYYQSYWDQPKNHDENVKQIQHDISLSQGKPVELCRFADTVVLTT
jgi:hypothetical protein